MRSHPDLPAQAALLSEISCLLGGGQQLWCTNDLRLWHCYRADNDVRDVGEWDDLWDYELVADPVRAAMTRLADPERYDFDGVGNHPERDVAVKKEIQILHLRHFALRRLTPAEIFDAIRSGIYSSLDVHNGINHYYFELRELWVARMLNAGWSIQRLTQTVGGRDKLIASVAFQLGHEERRLRAHARAARLRRVARLEHVLARDGRWTEERYHAELERVLHRAGLSQADLPDDVAYLN